jgi:ParB family chromosome partitioning protein
MSNKKGLGKGLAALMGEAKLHFNSPNLSADETEFNYIEISDIFTNPDQPRKNIEHEPLLELADSIKENGVLQPIIVQKLAAGYRIIAGERRWRASQIAGLKKVPAIIKNRSLSGEFELALIENIQRKDLNIIEESQGYLRLIGEFGYTQEQVAKSLGKSRSYIANILRLNTLPLQVREKVIANEITMGHAKTLIGLENSQELADIIVKKGLNVRQTELLVKNYKLPAKTKTSPSKNFESANNDSELDKLASYLSEKLGAIVTIEQGSIGGKIVILFEDIDELDKILTKMD